MIGPKRPKLTKRQERDAYFDATERDSVNGIERCQRCGVYGSCDRDHRQNRDRYNTTVGNLQLLGSDFGCGCHRWKTEHPAKALDEGYAVPRNANPLDYPAYRYGVGWVLYYDEPGERGEWWEVISETRARELMYGWAPDALNGTWF